MFSDSFGTLPDDVEDHPTVWQEVSLGLLSSSPS
jgi:hypothetical protein